jgi:hypothetical protein
MPPLDFTPYENFVFLNEIERASLTPREHLVKNSALPLKNRLMLSQKRRLDIEIEKNARNNEIFAAVPVLVCAKIVPTMIRFDLL